MTKKKVEPKWELCSCKRNYTPPDTRCNACLEEDYFKGINIHYNLDDAWNECPMVDSDVILEVIRKLDAQNIHLRKKLTDLRKKLQS